MTINEIERKWGKTEELDVLDCDISDLFLERLKSPVWVNYPAIKASLISLSRMILTSWNERPCSALIIGETGSGKTALAEKAILELVRHHGFEWNNFLKVSMPPHTRGNPVKCFLLEILAELNHPLADRRSTPVAALQVAVMKTLRACKFKAIFFDEAHQMIRSPSIASLTTVADELKKIISVSNSSVILIGLPILEQMISYNEEVNGRFRRIYRIDPLQPDNYGQFVINVEKLYVDVETPSLFKNQDAIEMLYELTQGRLALTVDLIRSCLATLAFEGAKNYEITKSVIKRTISQCRLRTT